MSIIGRTCEAWMTIKSFILDHPASMRPRRPVSKRHMLNALPGLAECRSLPAVPNSIRVLSVSFISLTTTNEQSMVSNVPHPTFQLLDILTRNTVLDLLSRRFILPSRSPNHRSQRPSKQSQGKTHFVQTQPLVHKRLDRCHGGSTRESSVHGARKTRWPGSRPMVTSMYFKRKARRVPLR